MKLKKSFSHLGMMTRQVMGGGRRDFIKDFFHQRQITKLIHFTDRGNLGSILYNGILSRVELENRGYRYSYDDSMRLDYYLDYISISITKPNLFLLKYFMEKRKIRKAVILEINAEMLWKESANLIFCNTNAATSGCNKGSNLRDLEAMFADTVDVKWTRHRDMNTHINETTGKQAEILWEGCVKKRIYNKSLYLGINKSKVVTMSKARATRLYFESTKKVIEREIEFDYHRGLSRTQKIKNRDSLHKAIMQSKNAKDILEISTKSDIELGHRLSAFNLRLDDKPLEILF